jgi:hypothetical protein
MPMALKVAKPDGDGYKRGVRFVIKLSKECGGDVREFASNAAAFLDGAKSLMTSYETEAKRQCRQVACCRS